MLASCVVCVDRADAEETEEGKYNDHHRELGCCNAVVLNEVPHYRFVPGNKMTDEKSF